MTINKKELESLVKMEMDEEAKRTFLAMVREEQLLAIMGMQAYIRSDLANVKKKQMDFEQELRQYRMQRERREDEHDHEIMNTTQKIVKALQEAKANEFNAGIWFRDKVLPGIISLITLGILYLVFGGKLP
jgi:hypothetical protein